jgi:hypothetical protein
MRGLEGWAYWETVHALPSRQSKTIGLVQQQTAHLHVLDLCDSAQVPTLDWPK